jgi:hypothetical protein
LNATERRLSVSRVRENCMHGLKWQEMETGVLPTAPSPDPTEIGNNINECVYNRQ